MTDEAEAPPPAPEPPEHQPPASEPVQQWAELALAIVAVAEVVLEGYSWKSALRQFQLRAKRKYEKQWLKTRLKGQVSFASLLRVRDAEDNPIPGPQERFYRGTQGAGFSAKAAEGYTVTFDFQMKGRTRRLWHRPDARDASLSRGFEQTEARILATPGKFVREHPAFDYLRRQARIQKRRQAKENAR